MFTKIHKNDTNSVQKTIYNHLYNMMVAIHAKDGRYITESVKQAIHETAEADIKRMISDGSLITYYERLKRGQV